MTDEHRLMNEIMVALSEHGSVFRMNAGDFWQGRRVYSKEFSQPALIELRRVLGLPKGFSDLLFIGKDKNIAFIEVKTKIGHTTEEQNNFLLHMREAGYKAGVARSINEALKIIKEA